MITFQQQNICAWSSRVYSILRSFDEYHSFVIHIKLVLVSSKTLKPMIPVTQNRPLRWTDDGQLRSGLEWPLAVALAAKPELREGLLVAQAIGRPNTSFAVGVVLIVEWTQT